MLDESYFLAPWACAHGYNMTPLTGLGELMGHPLITINVLIIVASANYFFPVTKKYISLQLISKEINEALYAFCV